MLAGGRLVKQTSALKQELQPQPVHVCVYAIRARPCNGRGLSNFRLHYFSESVLASSPSSSTRPHQLKGARGKPELLSIDPA
mmetsp:Transcript_19236/g.48151  ORF Transcript_19236/g.48151 Transcript_19236/m.48151 type:complete len:82 (-) Transcript_19236:292-537(-)